MANNDSFPLANSGKKPQQQENQIDFSKIYRLIISKWYYFLISLIVALICAFLYNTYTISTYRVSASLLIDEEKEGALLGNDQVLNGFGLGAAMKNLDNQIMALSSRTLVGKTLDELNYYLECYNRGLFNKIALYPDSPIRMLAENGYRLPQDIEFTFIYIGDSLFSLESKSEDSIELNIKASFGENIKYLESSFHIECESETSLNRNKNQKIYFIYHSREKLVESYCNKLKVDPVSKLGTILRISLEGTNKTKEMDFLNKLIEIFLNNSLDKKNEEAIRTIAFIDDQLIGISDSLVITENKLQEFRSRNRVMDLSAQGQAIINQAVNLENEKARLVIEDNYYNYLAEYLLKDNIGEVPIAPATMGITDPGLTKLVADLADLQGQLYSKSMGEKNPLQSQLAQRIRNTKEALRETLNGVRRSNNLAMSEVTSQIRTVNAQATALPMTERQLLGIERKFKLNDELYTFLLEKRAIAQIQKASNVPDNEIIDASEADTNPVRPKTTLVYFFAFLIGIGFPFFWIWFIDTFNLKVQKAEDLKKITNMPIVGQIPHNQLRKNTVVLEEPQLFITDAFRAMRSRIQFFTKDNKSTIILITSSIPEEGKTFIAINLASVYSLMGKRTVLVDFDLRRPQINTEFSLGNESGISTLLTGETELQNITKATSFENLFVIPAGPIPPNPSELIAMDKTTQLLNNLREMFEYIIIDSSPIGTVSDTLHLAPFADASILIVRQNKTPKDLLESTLKEVYISDFKNLCIVFNDLGPDYIGVSYKERYGYSYENVKSKK
jgi:tyrosine-protein kinase Etk/Wzc